MFTLNIINLPITKKIFSHTNVGTKVVNSINTKFSYKSVSTKAVNSINTKFYK